MYLGEYSVVYPIPNTFFVVFISEPFLVYSLKLHWNNKIKDCLTLFSNAVKL